MLNSSIHRNDQSQKRSSREILWVKTHDIEYDYRGERIKSNSSRLKYSIVIVA